MKKNEIGADEIIQIFVAAFIIAKKKKQWKQFKCPSAGTWNVVYLHNEILSNKKQT